MAKHFYMDVGFIKHWNPLFFIDLGGYFSIVLVNFWCQNVMFSNKYQTILNKREFYGFKEKKSSVWLYVEWWTMKI